MAPQKPMARRILLSLLLAPSLIQSRPAFWPESESTDNSIPRYPEYGHPPAAVSVIQWTATSSDDCFSSSDYPTAPAPPPTTAATSSSLEIPPPPSSIVGPTTSSEAPPPPPPSNETVVISTIVTSSIFLSDSTTTTTTEFITQTSTIIVEPALSSSSSSFASVPFPVNSSTVVFPTALLPVPLSSSFLSTGPVSLSQTVPGAFYPIPSSSSNSTTAAFTTTVSSLGTVPAVTLPSSSLNYTVLYQSVSPGVFVPITLPITTTYTSSIPTLQSTSATADPATLGTVKTSLEDGGRTSVIPFNTTVLPSASQTLEPITTSLGTASFTPTVGTASNVFQAMATGSVESLVGSRSDHPLPKLGINSQTKPVGTNKFYANFFLGGQNMSSFTYPYSVSWAKGNGASGSWGLAVSHTNADQVVFGEGDPASYYINPLGIQSMVLSAVELTSTTTLTTSEVEAFSINVHLSADAISDPLVTFPLVQGMGFITGVYHGATPIIQSGVLFDTLEYTGSLFGGSTFKYHAGLKDGSTWCLYVTPDGSEGAPPFTFTSGGTISGPAGFFGTVQITKLPSSDTDQDVYDASAGVYAQNASISATVDGSTASYTLAWGKGGQDSRTLLMFALPHHIESFDPNVMTALITDIQLKTTTKGMATLIYSDFFTMIEDSLPDAIGFQPWSAGLGNVKVASVTAANAINNAAASELNQDMDAQTNLDSMYFSGKGLAKFAGVIYAANDLASNSNLAAAGLQKLTAAFSTFVNNNQVYPLVYDTVWGGVVSTGTYVTGDAGRDFGNTYYNDHHFHYGYFVYSAAVIAYLDPSWLESDGGKNKQWVDMLVRDYANPSADDPEFPFQRNYDWYHGHSWAKGLFESGDGKDEESSSEDAFSTYALKMWGKVTGDANMEARGNLQLAVTARALRNYFLLESNNENQPAEFIGNKVTGILFDNKVDHTTYFGTAVEYIQGIHMIPLNPSSSYTRPVTFVEQEWDTYFSDTPTSAAGVPASSIQDGWRGILMANYALVDPSASFAFFNSPDFNNAWLDGGASRTWYLAYAAGLGGAWAATT
ncbi:glycoside hydrolase family 81 protein [Aulographum hederae CBS 113979]|uniref:glucan endo-1,3-beta-D-glucosidase n=1 Tax=Aulographum hederae CBS 113979 TaxID=1176131 RepID=A0A6G1GT34_9PEZI|nr:glycoside hydrolase family 81 protein [Aulographum hederae CBS 113979]